MRPGILTGIILLNNSLFAQETALFETTIYVEDSIGNIDSVVIGHDPAANYEYNPQFGEYDIPIPFDSIFEVRAAHYGDFSSHFQDMVLSKKIIGGVELSAYFEPWGCYLYPESIVLFIHARHQPVKVSWQREVFNDIGCRTGSMLTSHYLHYLTPYWMEYDSALSLTACMAEDSQYTQYLFDYEDFGFWKYEEIDGIGMDTVFAMMVTTFPENFLTPCMGIVSYEVSIPDSEQVSIVFPNPVRDILYIKSTDVLPVEYELHNIDGTCVLHGCGASIDLTSLLPSIYFVTITNLDGSRSIHKIIKQ